MHNEEIKVSDITQETIDSWKAKYEEVFEVPVGDKVCYLRSPDMAIWTAAFAVLSTSKMAYRQVLVNNCWLAGDPEIKTDEDYFQSLCDEIDDLLELEDAIVSREGDNCIVKLGKYSCTMKRPDREMIKDAEKRNPQGIPFKTNINLEKKLWVSGDQEIRQQTKLYMGLLTAVGNLREKKEATLKKL